MACALPLETIVVGPHKAMTQLSHRKNSHPFQVYHQEKKRRTYSSGRCCSWRLNSYANKCLNIQDSSYYSNSQCALLSNKIWGSIQQFVHRARAQGNNMGEGRCSERAKSNNNTLMKWTDAEAVNLRSYHSKLLFNAILTSIFISPNNFCINHNLMYIVAITKCVFSSLLFLLEFTFSIKNERSPFWLIRTRKNVIVESAPNSRNRIRNLIKKYQILNWHLQQLEVVEHWWCHNNAHKESDDLQMNQLEVHSSNISRISCLRPEKLQSKFHHFFDRCSCQHMVCS